MKTDCKMYKALKLLCEDKGLLRLPASYLARRILVVAREDVDPMYQACRILGRQVPERGVRGLVYYIRLICSHEFGDPIDYPFFSADYLEGEDADDAILRLFNQERPHHDTDIDTILALCYE